MWTWKIFPSSDFLSVSDQHCECYTAFASSICNSARIIYGRWCLIQDNKYVIDFIKHFRMKRQITASDVIRQELVRNAAWMAASESPRAPAPTGILTLNQVAIHLENVTHHSSSGLNLGQRKHTFVWETLISMRYKSKWIQYTSKWMPLLPQNCWWEQAMLYCGNWKANSSEYFSCSNGAG